MKKIVLLLISCYYMAAMGQNLISPITISLPTNPPANIADWATTIPPLMIMAQTKLVNGQVNGTVIESKILVTIQSGGSKVCGSYTPQTAPNAGFTSVTKNWSGAAAVNLLGQTCTLKPGTYELCVQFYAPYYNGSANALIGQSCKSFTIADAKAENYTPPTNVFPDNKKEFKESELKGPITFRWTPIVPKPQGNVTYRLKVWQLMQGQSGTQAMRTNQPIVTKDVDNLTQAVITDLNSEPCMLPRLCSYVWNVEALSKDAIQSAGKGFGMSEPSAFKIILTDPSTGCFKLDTTQYKVTCKGYDAQGKPIYNLSNLILTNIGSNPGRTGLHNTPATNYITPSGFIVGGLTPALANPINVGSSINIGFDILGATGTTANFVVNSTIIDPTNPNLYCDKTIGVSVDLPLCICQDCKEAQFSINNPTVNVTNVTNGIYTASGTLSITGVSAIYGIEMQVQSYSYTATPTSCSNGVTSVENSGVFNGSTCTINGLPVSMLNETVSGLSSTNNGIAKNIKLTSTIPLPSSMPFNLSIGLPTPLAGLNADCCKMNYTFCLKIKVFYDKDKCNSCSFNYCFPAFTN